MTDRRPLGTGPATADLSRTRDTEPQPRALLAAERLPPAPAADDAPVFGATLGPDGRRTLGTGPAGL